MTTENAKIIYTKIDEAPALATYSLLPILQAFTKDCGIEFALWDISLAGRILASFPEVLTGEQQVPDYLDQLAKLVKHQEANIVKLPNISASIPQLKDAIAELQSQGYNLPSYPENAGTEDEKKIQERYARVLGSAVNPVLREGNSDRRAALSVKKHGLKYPHKMMKPWTETSKTRVSSMEEDCFFSTEKSVTVEADSFVTIEYIDNNGTSTRLKGGIPLLAGEIIDSSVMNIKALRKFYETQMQAALEDDVLFSLHLKATMMKVSDPIMFGHCTEVYYKELLAKHGALLDELGVNFRNGIGDLYNKLDNLPVEKRAEIESDIRQIYQKRPALAMVDSFKGITNLHVPNSIIIDASMPVVIRDGGRMWGADNTLHDTIAVVPDPSYATMYQEVVEDCKRNGAFDPATMGSVANVGLMAQKAEEYGSHDKTFEAPGDGVICVIDNNESCLLKQTVEKGDIFRMCQTRDEPVKDWVKLAVNRARASGEPAIFWLDEKRGHDKELIKKVRKYLPEHDTAGLEFSILPPVEAMARTLARVRKGENTIAVTGNVLRDYLTDLFPILELGTSARMLSIVPLMGGGGLFETGAGGSAPKHVQQFLQENHLRWDSLGEFCALVASFEHLANAFDNKKAAVLAKTLDEAIGKHLEQGKAPSRKVNELDNRGSHFYLALYWAEALAAQSEDSELQAKFQPAAGALQNAEAEIIKQLNAAQGKPVDIGGYYHADAGLLEKAMRPSTLFNEIIDQL